tara:strand:+ start:123 stop:791 length:669 start_codon:yes stop_codon:yes gene_type:complete
MLINSNIKFKYAFNRRKRTNKSRPYKQTNTSSKKRKSKHKKKPRTKRKRTTKRNKKNRIGGTWDREQELINNILDIRVDLIRLINFYNRKKHNNDSNKLNYMKILIAAADKDLTDAYSKYATYIQENRKVDHDAALKLSKDNIKREVTRLDLIAALDSSNSDNIKATHESALAVGLQPNSHLDTFATQQLAALTKRGDAQHKYPLLASSIYNPYNSGQPFYD